MTENCAISHATLPGSYAPGTVGLPYEGVESRVNPETGEIQMRSPALMQGYYREPEMTAAAMTADGWLRTGDKGQIDAKGLLSITGRVKDMFKTSKGKYIAPAPIEDLLVINDGVEACCVTGANFAQPFAVCMLSQDAAKSSEDSAKRQALEKSLTLHLQAVNARLEPHEKLDFLAVVVTPWTPESGMVTPTLKVKRDSVESRYGKHFENWLAQGRPVVWVSAEV